MRVVIDTNVVVSGLLSPYGPPAEIVRLVAAGELPVCYDARIIAEYREVLHRSAFGFDERDVEWFLDQLVRDGESVASRSLGTRLPDPDDEPFLEVAVASSADALVTGNIRHFPETLRHGVLVCTPAAFIETLREEYSSK
jgi:putative PIN family toxin of toxin-antitoxin system